MKKENLKQMQTNVMMKKKTNKNNNTLKFLEDH